MADGHHFEKRSPYLSEISPDFDEILYTAADFELGERHVIKNEKVALDGLQVRQNVFLVISGSASTVLTATGQVNGRWRILTPHRIETHEPTATKFRTFDYLREGTPSTKFGTNPSTGGFWAYG